jgi:hypothetical protein
VTEIEGDVGSSIVNFTGAMFQEIRDDPSEMPSAELSKVRNFLITIFSAALITLAFSIASMVFSLRASRHADKLQPIEFPATSGKLPWRYLVDDSYILPPTDQKNVGTCWCFSTIYGLSAQYRAQGIRSGLLDPDEYVSFSVQAWLRFLRDQCVAHPEVKACHYGGLLENSSEDQEVESLYYFYNAWTENVSSHLLPESVCPYLPAPPKDSPDRDFFKCPGYEAALEPNQNPVRWRLKSMSLAYTVQGVKELLLRLRRSLGFGTPLPDMVYFIPCDGSPFANSTDCASLSYPCPEYVGARYCHKLEIDGRENDGIFMGSVDPKFMGELGGHAMDVVGYNDEWIYKNRFQSSATSAQLKGGFVLHNSWRSNGHSVRYWMGLESEENEAVICPNHAMATNWIPATLECVQAQAASGAINHYLNCSSGIERVRGRGRTNGSDLLYCQSTHCNSSLLYVLERQDDDVHADFLPSGLANVRLITIDNSTTPYTIGQTTVAQVPFWALSKWFAPIDEAFVPNEPDSCGYWMFPYETVDNMLRIQWDLLDNFRVVDIEVEFENSSYAKHMDSARYNRSLLQSSTKRINRTKFDGPLPYQYIY